MRLGAAGYTSGKIGHIVSLLGSCVPMLCDMEGGAGGDENCNGNEKGKLGSTRVFFLHSVCVWGGGGGGAAKVFHWDSNRRTKANVCELLFRIMCILTCWLADLAGLGTVASEGDVAEGREVEGCNQCPDHMRRQVSLAVH